MTELINPACYEEEKQELIENRTKHWEDNNREFGIEVTHSEKQLRQ
jgi:hypothetical protein